MILASASPRRRELLLGAGFDLTIEPADIDESRLLNEQPLAYVERLARTKAEATRLAHGPLAEGEVLLAADTIVWTRDNVLGKPSDKEDACRMLSELSGDTHCVSTGVCLMLGTTTRSFVETTKVTFRPITDDEIRAYVATGEPMDKAGSYAIQGGAKRFVTALDGDYDNVVGLPLQRVMREIDALRDDASSR